MKNIFKLNKREGSALLMSLFIMATVGVVSFGSTRLYITELRSTSNLTNTPQAFYAAESALENGLLAYRYNSDVKFYKSCIPNSSDDYKVTCPTDTSGNSVKFASLTKLANNAAVQINMAFMGEKLVKTESLKKDNSATLRFDPTKNGTLTIHWAQASDNSPGSSNNLAPCESADNGLRVMYVNSTTGDTDVNQPLYNATFYRYSSADGGVQSVPLSTANLSVDTIIIRPIGCDIRSYSMLNTSGNVDTGVTTINGLGKYNGISRQLVAKVDRSTGQLNSIFAYTLFGSNKVE